MSLLDAVILGLVQGLSEFLPISSSGHLVIAQELLGVEVAGIFLEIVLHAATLLAVLLVYRVKIWRLLAGILRRDPLHLRYGGYLVLASVPAAIVGIGFPDALAATFDAPAITGVMLLVTGVFLFSTRWAGRRSAAVIGPGERRDPTEVGDSPSLGNAVAMGIAQCFALLPGISRSGSTITAGLWGGMRSDTAAEFSFLMSVIAVGGASLLQLAEFGEWVRVTGAPALAAGFLASLASGILAIKALLWLLRRQSFHAFAYYVWTVGGLFLLYLGTA